MRHGGAIPVAVAPENGCATPRIPPKRLRLPCTPIVSAISFFRANVVLSGVMASFPDQSVRIPTKPPGYTERIPRTVPI
jgi:hypothetical protein